MLIFIGCILVWVVVAIGCHVHRKQFYKKNPHLWGRRHEGLIAFSDSQYWWMMTLWPLSLIATVLLLLFLGVCGLIELWIEWRAQHRASKR